MRNIILASIALLFSSSLLAQTYVGARGGYGSTWMFNKNISDAGDELDYKGSYAGNVALHVIQMVSPQSGIGLQVGTSTLVQQTQGTFSESEYLGETKLKYTDIGLFYTYLAEGGLYLEVGPQFSLRKDEIEEAFELTDSNGIDRERAEMTTIDPNMNSSTVFAVLGIGGNISLSEKMRLGIGAQFGYGLTDLTKELTLTEYAETEMMSQISTHSQGYDIDMDTFEQSINYQSTSPVFGRLNLGLYYIIGGKSEKK